MADTLTQIEQLRAAMAALEAQRALLGDDIVDAGLAPLRDQIGKLQTQQQKQSTSDERRLITILFADVVGSTALAEQMDPEEWHDVISKLHATLGNLIARYGGMVDKYLGDGIIALYGAQQPSESDTENAVRTALEIQSTKFEAQGLALQLRTGVHTGLVVTGEIGSDTHREFTASGDAMNLAARLESAAPPGGILISHDTYRHIRGVFDVTMQPPLLVRGKREALQTYLVRRAKPRPFRTVNRGVAGILTSTVGRAEEFEKLKQAYTDAFENRRAVWAQLIGEPGVGKSRLLEDLRDWVELRDETVRVLRGRATVADSNQPYALVRRIWFDRFQVPDDAPLAQAEAKWVEGFCELAGVDDQEPAHALGLLVGLPFKDSPYIKAMRNDPNQVRGRALVVSRELFHRMREQLPVELLLDDLQWADASSWEYLRQVVLHDDLQTQSQNGEGAETPPNGLFVLGTARPDWNPPAELAPFRHGSTLAAPPTSSVQYCPINVSPLSDEATLELAQQLLGQVVGVPDEVVDLLVRRAEGIPYYAEELVNWFIDRGIIDTNARPWRFIPARLNESPLPATLHHLLLTRLSALAEVERATLQRGAIFGRHFWTGGVQALGVSGSDKVLAGLAPRGLVECQPESAFAGETEWSFHHMMLRDVTYESVLKRERATLHRNAAGWLEEQAQRAGRLDQFSGLIGEHYERAGMAETAANWYLRAGDQASGSSAVAEARNFYDRALNLFPPNHIEGRWRGLIGREAVLDLSAERKAQQADLAALRALTDKLGDDARKAQVHLSEARYAWGTGDFRATVLAADRVLAVTCQACDELTELRALALKTSALMRLGELAAAREAAEEVQARVGKATDPAAAAFALGRVAVYYIETGDLARAAQLYKRSIELAQSAGDRVVQATALGNLAVAYTKLGLYKLARAICEQALPLHQALGDRRRQAYALMNLADISLHTMDGRTARKLVEQALAIIKATGDAFGEAGCIHTLGEIAEMMGDHGVAVEHYTAAYEKYMGLGARAAAIEAQSGLARCTLAQGNLAEARRMATEAWEYISAQGTAGMNSTLVYQSLAEIFDALGDDKFQLAIKAGYQELVAYADKISDQQWARSFLENVPENRAVVEMWERTAQP